MNRIKKILHLFLVTGMLITFSGCSKDKDKDKKNLTLFALFYLLTQSSSSSYCDASTTSGVCIKGTITVSSSSSKYEDSSNCTSVYSGTVVSSCPTSNALGTCTINSYSSGSFSLTNYSATYYSGASTTTYTASSAEATCTSFFSGTWTAASIKENVKQNQNN